MRPTLFKSGQPVRALRNPLNKIVNEVNRNSLGIRSLNIVRTPPIWKVEIKTLNASDMICVLIGESANNDAIEFTVIPPPTFTETSREGVTYAYTNINTRTADATENQELTPKYVVGDELRIMEDFESDGSYIDLNIDGRQWAKVP